MKKTQQAYHRNGITGTPFNVAVVHEGLSRYVVIQFDETRIAALDIDMLTKEDIEFGSNSCRGEYFAPVFAYPLNKLEGKK